MKKHRQSKRRRVGTALRERAIEVLIERWRPLANAATIRTARSMGWDRPTEDQFAAGMAGLLTAITKYDGARGAAFGTHVWNCVRYEVIGATRGATWFTTPGGTPRDAFPNARFTSLDQMTIPQDGGGDGRAPRCGWQNEDSLTRQTSRALAREDGEVERIELHESLSKALRGLTPAQRRIIREHDEKGRTLTDMAREAGVSKMMMSKRRSKALRALREVMEKEGWK